MGCSSSTKTSAQDPSRPNIKPEESNGASNTGTANESITIAEDSETLPDQTKPESSPQTVGEPAATPLPTEGTATPALAVVEAVPDTATLSSTTAPVADVSDGTETGAEAPAAPVQTDSTPELPAAPVQTDSTPELPAAPAQTDSTPELPAAPAQTDSTPELPAAPAQTDSTPEAPSAQDQASSE